MEVWLKLILGRLFDTVVWIERELKYLIYGNIRFLPFASYLKLRENPCKYFLCNSLTPCDYLNYHNHHKYMLIIPYVIISSVTSLLYLR